MHRNIHICNLIDICSCIEQCIHISLQYICKYTYLYIFIYIEGNGK